MEDLIRTLLEVVRAQHTAAEGSEERPLDINDIIDMALNITGRPDEEGEAQDLSAQIEQMAQSLAPDIFPPKTFEEMDDSEQAQSAVNMIEESLLRGRQQRAAEPVREPEPPMPEEPPVFYQSIPDEEPEEAALNPQETADLNELIYNNFMQMMGLNDPKVEYPFDRSQIRYGREKTATEMLAEEEATKRAEAEAEARRQRPVSAWELAQSAVDKDEEAHQKEEYVPEEVKMPETKSASQLAAEAIARAQEEDRQKLEIEKRAERLMEEAKKRGKDPMAFALHQQEVLNYMEKNSDELVSFEDYEDLSPEEKLEIERQLYRERQLADGVAPEDVRDEVPDEILDAAGLLDVAHAQDAPEAGAEEAAAPAMPAFSDEMLRQISQEVVDENAEMILSEDANADLAAIHAAIFENLKQMMRAGNGVIHQEDVESLIGDVIARNAAPESAAAFENAQTASAPAGGGMGGTPTPQAEQPTAQAAQAEDVSAQSASAAETAQTAPAQSTAAAESNLAQTTEESQTASAQPAQSAQAAEASSPQPEQDAQPMSAVELARMAQAARAPQPKEETETKSAVDLAKEALENARKEWAAAEHPEELSEDDFDFDDLTFEESEETPEPEKTADAGQRAETVSATENDKESAALDEMATVTSKEEQGAEGLSTPDDQNAVQGDQVPSSAEELQEAATISAAENAQKAAPATEDAQKAESEKSGMDAAQEAEEAVQDSEEKEAEPEEEYEYVDPSEYVLGEHTQAEIDEALENLASLGLAGDVYERAKRMLLLELAGSEAVLDAWLSEQENGKKKKAAVSALDAEEELDDLSELDEDDLERELTEALDEDFVAEDAEEKPSVADEEETAEASKDTETLQEEGEEAEATETEESQQSEVEEDASIAEEAEKTEKTEETETEQEAVKASDDFVEETAADPAETEPTPEVEEDIRIERTRPEPAAQSRRATAKSSHRKGHKNMVKRREKPAAPKEEPKESMLLPADQKAEKKEFQVSARNPFALKNAANFMDQFENYIVDTQENRKLSTGFRRLDAMLRYGLHKGSYFVDSKPQYLKNSFMQQMADGAAQSGVDVLYISTELSRYDLMVDTISRLSYEMNRKDETKAVSSMAIMTGEDGADIRSLKDELNWYRGRISEHLFVLDQEAVAEYVASMQDASAEQILEELIRSIVTEGAHKPVVFIDNIENILSVDDLEDMKPLMEGIRRLAGELGIPILMSYGYAQAESESELYPEEEAFHASLGNLCDVYMELNYAEMITEDYEAITEEDIEEMREDGETLLVNVHLHKNRRPMKASCQIQGVPKFNFFEE